MQKAYGKRRMTRDCGHQARLAEAEARKAQSRAEVITAEENIRSETARRAHGEVAIRDAEIALLRAKGQSEAQALGAQLKAELEATHKAEAELRKAKEEGLQKAEAEALQKMKEEELRKAKEEELRKVKEEELQNTRAELEATRKAAGERQQITAGELQQALSKLAAVRKEARGLILTLPGSIYFDVNKADVKPAMHVRLTEIAQALAKVPEQKILIEGHTDSDGLDDYNLQLSRLRADAVHAVLIEGGIPPDRIETKGYGKTRPIASNATAAGKAQNRRVEIVLPGTAGTKG
jgi:outer membrane protein OmpA-like peptidoglycan-associated protein